MPSESASAAASVSRMLILTRAVYRYLAARHPGKAVLRDVTQAGRRPGAAGVFGSRCTPTSFVHGVAPSHKGT
jgi:hypothetical protein